MGFGCFVQMEHDSRVAQVVERGVKGAGSKWAKPSLKKGLGGRGFDHLLPHEKAAGEVGTARRTATRSASS